MEKLRSLPLESPQPAQVVTKAAVRAAERLGVTARVLARVIGVSEATVSRMRRGEYLLEPATKPYELALLFVRLFRSLDAITGGDERVAREWIANFNTVISSPPLERMQTVSGLVEVIAYLDARRARI